MPKDRSVTTDKGGAFNIRESGGTYTVTSPDYFPFSHTNHGSAKSLVVPLVVV
jgi:hypothetical protein